jgi:hypothetical protein
MNKLIVVTGPKGCGKTTFIKNTYSGQEDHFVLDLAAISFELFGNYTELEGDGLADIYNHASEKGLFALLDDETIVVEFCTGIAFDDEMLEIVQFAKRLGIQVQVINMENGEVNCQESLVDQSQEGYSSYDLREDTLQVLEGLLETYELNQEFELVVELGGESGSINFYKMVREGQERFFFLSTKLNAFDFEPQYDFEKDEQVVYLRQYATFEEAFQAFLIEFPVYQLVPIQVNGNYKSAFQQAYVESLENPANQAWKSFLN